MFLLRGFDGDICSLLMAFVLFTVQQLYYVRSRCFEVFMRNNRLFKTIGLIFFGVLYVRNVHINDSSQSKLF